MANASAKMAVLMLSSPETHRAGSAAGSHFEQPM